jgi:hypothetical protein
MEKDNDKIKSLRIFFAISNAVFICMETVEKVYGRISIPSHMHVLYNLAKDEIDKENPDMEKMDYLIMAIQLEAEKYKKL